MFVDFRVAESSLNVNTATVVPSALSGLEFLYSPSSISFVLKCTVWILSITDMHWLTEHFKKKKEKKKANGEKSSETLTVT